MLSKCNFMGTWEWTQSGRKTMFQLLPKTSWIVYWQYMAGTSIARESINLLKSHQKLQHTRGIRKELTKPHQHASCQFCAAGRAQVCSSAYCSLAWVNKEKTGAIRRTCQAWNSLLMFTPFTLGLSQRCCFSYFWQGPTAICFSVKKANKEFQYCAIHNT